MRALLDAEQKTLLDEGMRASKHFSGIHHSGTGPFEYTALKGGVLKGSYARNRQQLVKWKLAL
jgi:hypothetical protein